jgi:serine/threonine protein kinase
MVLTCDQKILIKSRCADLNGFFTSTSTDEFEGFLTMTPRYCAPEMAADLTIGPYSDLWSFGCVFLEILTTLCNKTVFDMKAFLLTEHHTPVSAYHSNQEAISRWY